MSNQLRRMINGRVHLTDWRIGLAAVLGIAFLTGNALISFHSSQMLVQQNQRVTSSQRVLTVIEATLAALSDAEAGQRGYILTGNRSYLTPYTVAVPRIVPRLKLLQQLTQNDGAQHRRLAIVEPLITQKMTELAETIALQQASKAAQARQVVLSNRGMILMDSIRSDLNGMVTAALSNRTQETVNAQATERAATLTLLVATLFAIALLLGFLLLIARMLARRNALAEQRAQLLIREHDARESAEKSLRLREEFLSIAGHELRTPLTSVLGNVQLASMWLGTGDPQPAQLAKVKTVIARTEYQASRLNRLVQDLLDASRMQADTLEIRMVPCDLGALVLETVKDHQHLAPTRTISLDPERLPSIPINADADRITQVLTNFLTNALRYSGSEQPVTVGVRQEMKDSGAWVSVWVQDAGPGLDSNEQERVWERFYRSPGVKHLFGSSEGLGLGLYISRTIIERHQGTVGIESQPGNGARFWFALPVAVAEDTAEAGSVAQGVSRLHYAAQHATK